MHISTVHAWSAQDTILQIIQFTVVLVTAFRLVYCCGTNSEMSCIYVTQTGYTPLISAADRGHCDVVIDLLALNADVNAQTNVS